MIHSVEEAAARMHELAKSDIAERLVEANEAETRLLLIDQVLEILGWRPEEYKPEQPTSGGGFTDYQPGSSHLIPHGHHLSMQFRRRQVVMVGR